MFAALILLFMCLSVTADSTHQQCQTPSMTGDLAVSNTNKGAYTVGGYVYDSGAKKLRFTVKSEECFNSNTVKDVLMFFEEGTLYEIDNTSQSCKKKSMTALNPLQLPSNATFITKMQLGRASVKGEGIVINVWQATAWPELKAPYFPSFTMGCLPFSMMYTADSTTLIINILNVEVEIKDSDQHRLNLPSFCEGATVEATPEGTVNSFFHVFL